MVTGIHILLTLKCTNECDHCFLHCGPSRNATFTLRQMRTLIGQIQRLGTVRIVYFEGGEPFLFYPLLLEGLRMVREAGFDAGIVTALHWSFIIASKTVRVVQRQGYIQWLDRDFSKRALRPVARTHARICGRRHDLRERGLQCTFAGGETRLVPLRMVDWRVKSMGNQDRKAIFITGSSSGLGRATAKLFASEGLESHRLHARPKEWKKN